MRSLEPVQRTVQIPPDGDLPGRLVVLEDGDHQAGGGEQRHQHDGVGAAHSVRIVELLEFTATM
jgi:hypothetical protein